MQIQVESACTDVVYFVIRCLDAMCVVVPSSSQGVDISPPLFSPPPGLYFLCCVGKKSEMGGGVNERENVMWARVPPPPPANGAKRFRFCLRFVVRKECVLCCVVVEIEGERGRGKEGRGMGGHLRTHIITTPASPPHTPTLLFLAPPLAYETRAVEIVWGLIVWEGRGCV